LTIHSRQIVIVDDEAVIRESLAAALSNDDMEIRTAAEADEALNLLAERPSDIVLSDVRMPRMDGLDLLREIRRRALDVDVVLMTAFDDMPTVAAAMREGAADFLVKPLDLHELRRVLSRVFDDRLARTREAPQARVAKEVERQFVGRHPQIIEIYKVVGQVAARRTNVLIRGESGTGKELIARAIHDQSPFAAEPFVAVNCSAIPATLLESELFGHVRGAFTGAVNARRGRFSQAGRGTIFLDEVGDASLEVQAKLLRVLQEQEFYPVGADRPERTEARVIAATHRNLEQMGIAGTFREDLYYRLRVVELTVPPLRDRTSDIPMLVQHLVAAASSRLSERVPVVSDEALEAIRRHNWPGNVRELENCLRRGVVLATSGVIRPEHLGLTPAPPAAASELKTLAQLEREHVARVLVATGGHKARAAQILGVSRPRLNRLMREYGLE
jgi:two-component system, NtrC family, response regulator HydG